MANSNFFVRQGLSVNNATTIAGANGQISVGSNLVVNTSTVFIGNSTVNTIANSSTLAIGSVTHNSSVIAVGSNVTVNTSGILIGNSTVNTIANSTAINISNNLIIIKNSIKMQKAKPRVDSRASVQRAEAFFREL